MLNKFTLIGSIIQQSPYTHLPFDRVLGFVEEQLKHSEAALACYKKALDYRRDKSRLIPA